MLNKIIFIMLLAASVSAHSATTPKGLIVLPGAPAPLLKLKDGDGKETDLVKLRGQWVLVHFWASWCGPCRKEMPTLQRMSEKLSGGNLRLLLINTAETDDEVFEFLAGVTPTLNSLMDRDGKVTEVWKPRGLPSSFLVDPRGRLRYLALGGREWDSPAYLAFLRAITATPARK